MGGLRKFAALLLAVACAAALAACGSGDSTTTASTQATTNATPQANAGGGNGSKSSGGGGGKPKSESQPSKSSGGGESSHSGERSASFRTPGGDNSIQEFGEEAGGEERAKATKVISTYYTASANEEWATICGLLSKKNLAQLEQFAAKIPKVKSKTCAGVIELVNSSTPGKPPDTIKGAVVSLRKEGSDGFALYHGIDGKPYSYTLAFEGGEWKLTSLGPTPLSF